MKEIKIRVNDENYNELIKLKNANAVSMNLLINAMIELYINEPKNTDKFLQNTKTKREHELRIYFTDDEFKFIKKQAKLTGLNSANKQAKFYIINQIENEKIFTPIEMKNLFFAVNDMNKLGRNLNALIMSIRDRKNEIKINVDNFEKMLNLIYEKIESITNIIKKYREILNTRT